MITVVVSEGGRSQASEAGAGTLDWGGYRSETYLKQERNQVSPPECAGGA